MSIRCTPFEVIADDAKQYRDKFKELGEVIQLLINSVWDEWRAWHVSNGTPKAIRDWQEKWTAFKKGEGDKPEKLGIFASDKVFSKHLYDTLRKEFPALATRPLTLSMNNWNAKVSKIKSARGSCPGWHSMLLHRQGIPQCVDPQPIPFDKANGRLIPPRDDKDHFSIEVKLESIQRVGRNGKPKSVLEPIRLRLWDKGRKMQSRVSLLRAIMRGDIELKGSSICWKGGKLFVNISHEISPAKKVEGDIVATFVPGLDRPATLFYGDRDKWIGGDGRIVASVRRQLMTQRWSRQQTYRKSASSARKGHGRNRAMSKLFILTNRWRDFVRTFNRNMVADLVRICQGEGIVEIAYERHDKTKLFLTKAGKSGERDSSGWDWFGLEKQMQDKLNEIGVRVKFIDMTDDNDVKEKELQSVS